MPKYSVVIKSTSISTYEIWVNADSVEDANEQAIQILHAGDTEPIAFAVTDDEVVRTEEV